MSSSSAGNFWTRGRKLAASAAAIAALGATAGNLAGWIHGSPGGNVPPAATYTTANVWIGNAGTCTRSGSLIAYSAATACSSFAAAWQAKTAGDRIVVKAGTYSSQPDVLKSASEGSMSTFECETAHACTVVGTLHFGKTGGGPSAGDDSPSYFTLDGIDFHGGITTEYYSSSNAIPNHVTLSNSHLWANDSVGNNVSGGCSTGCLKPFNFGGVSQLHIGPNVVVGPVCCDVDGGFIAGGRSWATNAVGDTVDGLYMHDVADSCSEEPSSVTSVYPCTGYGIGDGCNSNNCEHIDGLVWAGGQDATFQNSRIYESGGQPIFFTCNGGTAQFTGTWTLENLLIGPYLSTTENERSNIGNSCVNGTGNTANVTIRNSTFGGQFTLYADQWESGTLTLTNDVIASWDLTNSTGTGEGCSYVYRGGAAFNPTYSHNLLGNAACGGTDIHGTATFISNPGAGASGTWNLCQTAGSAGVNAGDPLSFSAADWAGVTRPVGGVPDIGACER